MKIPEKFDAIRPFEPEELPAVYDRLLSDPQFQQLLGYLYPQVPLQKIAFRMKECKTNLDFQLAFCYDFLDKLMAKASLGYDMDATSLDHNSCYTFISNHRDIVLDSALLDMLLVKTGFKSTCEIAIGDNLLSLPWVKDLVRINKSFIVERGLPLREMLLASKRLADYMHFVIGEKHDNIWIAQREGRAKDSNDRTQEAVLKMMSMGGEGGIQDRLQSLHLVPTAISYEYDPCDFLKAKEFQQKRDDAHWKKQPMDDVISMKTGIMGYKGHVHYHCAPCIDSFLATLDPDMPKQQVYRAVAEHIDHEIHRHYRLYPGNYVALDLLQGTADHADHYTTEERQQFETYLSGQLHKIDLPHKDEPYLRRCMLTMYANPAVNYEAAQ